MAGVILQCGAAIACKGEAMAAIGLAADMAVSAAPMMSKKAFLNQQYESFPMVALDSSRQCGLHWRHHGVARTCALPRRMEELFNGMHFNMQGMESVKIVSTELGNATSSLWLRYVQQLERHPLVMKSFTAGLLNALSDSFCQIVIEKCQTFDYIRLLSFTAIGMFLSGPGMHFWYGLLPKIIPVPGILGLCLRIAADQFVFTPLGTGAYFVTLLTLEGRNYELWTKLQQDWLPTVIANWKVWLPFQLVNFGLVPPQLQAGAACLLGVVWSVFISHAGHKK